MVSVVFPYYKRGDVFALALDSVLRQDFADYELIVVDNGSKDGVRQVVESHDAAVRLIELAENRGACGARNAGIAAARGEIIVVLDDDVGFVSPFELSRLVSVFDQHPDFQVLAFQICDPVTGDLRLRDWCHPRDWKKFSQSEFETHHFGEGAMAARREVFDKTGLYYEPFFYGAEGHDMEIRVLNQGFRILYAPRVRVWHRVSEKARSVDRQYYYFTRNYIWMAYKDYPALAGLQFLTIKMGMMLYFTLRLKCYASFWRGVRDGIRGLPKVRAARTPATRETLRRWAEFERERPGWRARLARHSEKPQI